MSDAPACPWVDPKSCHVQPYTLRAWVALTAPRSDAVGDSLEEPYVHMRAQYSSK